MRQVTFALVFIVAFWALRGLVFLAVDARIRARHREMLEVRDWQEKVQAMRRMTDQEGDA